MPGRSPFTNLVVYTHGSQVAVQPKQSGTSAQLDTLSVDLGTGAAQVLMSAPQSGTGREVLGIMGLCKLHKGVQKLDAKCLTVDANCTGLLACKAKSDACAEYGAPHDSITQCACVLSSVCMVLCSLEHEHQAGNDASWAHPACQL